MKKILIFCIVVITAVTLIGCAGSNVGDDDYYESTDPDLNGTGYDYNNNDLDLNRTGYYNGVAPYDGYGNTTFPYGQPINYGNGNNYDNGYGNRTNANNYGNRTNANNYGNGTNANNYGNGTNANYTNNANRNPNQVATQLENMEYVNDATCVINGDTALVGLDVSDQCTGYKLQDVKNKAKNNVKAMCPGVTNVSVSEDDDMYGRINTLSTDIRDGKTVNNISTQISDMVRNIVK